MKSFKPFCMLLLTFACSAAGVQAKAWNAYKSDDYGFSMLVPEGTKIETKEFGGGWGGIRCDHDGVIVLGVAKLGEQASAEDIEAFGVKATGVPADAWSQVDSGSGSGWKWYRTVMGKTSSKLAYGGYGVGPKGSYLLLIVTTPEDFEANRASYDQWYESIELN